MNPEHWLRARAHSGLPGSSEPGVTRLARSCSSTCASAAHGCREGLELCDLQSLMGLDRGLLPFTFRRDPDIIKAFDAALGSTPVAGHVARACGVPGAYPEGLSPS